MAAAPRFSPPPSVPGFSTLFSTQFKYVWRSLRRLGVAERDLEDVTHDVFVQVYRKLDSYEPARPIRPWLFGFAFRSASEYRRSARHRVEVLEEADAETSAPLVDDALARADDAKLVAEALAAIDFDRRAVLVAYELDEIPMKDIATATGVPLDTAYSRLRLGRADLAAAVKRIRLQRGER